MRLYLQTFAFISSDFHRYKLICFFHAFSRAYRINLTGDISVYKATCVYVVSETTRAPSVDKVVNKKNKGNLQIFILVGMLIVVKKRFMGRM